MLRDIKYVCRETPCTQTVKFKATETWHATAADICLLPDFALAALSPLREEQKSPDNTVKCVE